MIKLYKNGEEFLKENLEFLKEDYDQNQFLIMDADEYLEFDNNHYALRVVDEKTNKILCAICLSQYHLMITGDAICSKELIDYIIKNNLFYQSILCEDSIGDKIKEILDSDYHQTLNRKLSMDFLVCDTLKEDIDYSIVKTATINQVSELTDITRRFSEELDLTNNMTIDKMNKLYNLCRIIEVDKKIVACARMTRINDERHTASIGMVWTDKAYRGKHYARMCVLACLNELINKNYQVSLFVDRNNPISYHLYKSVGFVKTFGQTEYVLK